MVISGRRQASRGASQFCFSAVKKDIHAVGIQPTNQRSRDKNPQRKFSTMIKRMIIEIERDPTLYPEGNIVEVCIYYFQNPSHMIPTHVSIGVVA